MLEIWKDIVEYEGLYQVSNLGKVKSLFRYKKMLKGNVVSGGYIQIQLCKKGKATSYLIHRVVAFSFLNNPDNKPCVNHIDGNKTNNRHDNLEWVTYSENELHSYHILGKKPNKSRLGVCGSLCYNSKSVLQISSSGDIIKKFESIGEVERTLGIRHSNVQMVLNGKRHTAGGYYWKLAV